MSFQTIYSINYVLDNPAKRFSRVHAARQFEKRLTN